MNVEYRRIQATVDGKGGYQWSKWLPFDDDDSPLHIKTVIAALAEVRAYTNQNRRLTLSSQPQHDRSWGYQFRFAKDAT